MAELYGIARMTVARAVRELRERGLSSRCAARGRLSPTTPSDGQAGCIASARP
ncbi:hypothetical protein ACFWWB_35585 [Streptomyces sp. NPDC058690]|uniref:hypothetical protein n=1 Tax=Streptomyces sp. NPDC058690 TaxID=3346600 RepID=UPI00364603C0